MKVRVWKDLMSQSFFRVDDINAWPSESELLDRINSSPEFKAVADVGLPVNRNLLHPFELNGGAPEPSEQLKRWLVLQTSGVIVRRWIGSRMHRCLSQEDLEELYLAEGFTDTIYPGAQDVFRMYYKKLIDNIVSTLYQDKKVYNWEELELLVPVVMSPYYNRESIIQSYQSAINGLKTPDERAEIQSQISDFERL